MRPENPTSFTAFASDMMRQSENIVITAEKKLSLSYDERYSFDKALRINLKDIETFVLKEACSLLYILDQKGNIHSYDIYRNSLQKELFNISIETHSCNGMALYKNILFILDNNGLRAFSLVTWQLLWERAVEDAQSIWIDEKGIIYIATLSNNFLQYDMGGEQIATLTMEKVDTPISITTHKTVDGVYKLYILYASQVVVYDIDTSNEIAITPIESNEALFSSIAINAEGAVYVGSSLANEGGTLWWGTQDGKIKNRISTYDKAIKKMLFDCKDTLLVLDTEGFISVISLQKFYKNKGEIATIVDSTFEGCDWNKIQMSYEVPDRKGLVTVSIGAFDHLSSSETLSTLPSLPLSFENKKDIYLEDVIGRYLVVKITLQSDSLGEETPEFEKFKAYFPKETYLKYLPGIYQEDAQSKELMERYLSVFQTLMEGIEEKIENSHLLIDPETSPDSEFLNWLSLWLGLKREKNWTAAQWRELLSKAMYFFKRRGTREGLSELIALYTQISKEEDKPIIIEPFQTQCKENERIYNLESYTFCVIFKPKVLNSEEELNAVKRIVKLWKPAHTQGKVVVLKEKMVLGDMLYLGINTALKEEQFILGKAALSIDTTLADIEENAQIQSHARLGIDTQINY